MSDNGWMVGDHGFTSKVLPYRPASHVPFFVLGPGIKKNTESNTMVSNIDIAPTMLDLAGLSVPEYMHGKSLVNALKNKKQLVREVFIYEGVGKYGGSRPNLTAISDDYRLIITYKDETLNEEAFRELYHQKNDQWEMKNLASNPEYKSVVKDLGKAIEGHKKDILGM